MRCYYVKRSAKILREKGFFGLSKAFSRFIQHQLVSHTPLTKESQFKINTKKNDVVNKIRFIVPPDPWEVITIDTHCVDYQTRGVTDKYGLGQTKDGVWDKKTNLTPIEDVWIINGLEQRFIQEKDWINTTYYKKAEEKIEKRGELMGCSSPQEFLKDRCFYIDNLYKSICEYGYLSKSKSNQRGMVTHRGHYRDSLEVLVGISRDGDIILNDGRHRFAIARILDLKIPVQVVCRHKKWQDLRDNIYNHGLPERSKMGLQNHPDIQDVFHERS